MKWAAIILLILCISFQQYKIQRIEKTQATIVRSIGLTVQLIEKLMWKTSDLKGGYK